MDIVELGHPMLVIDHFELIPNHNNLMTYHAMGYTMDNSEPSYVVFPIKEATRENWVDVLISMTKGYPGVAKQLLRKGLGDPIAEQVMAVHGIS